MAALVPGFEPLRVEGDLFLISDEAVAAIDELETGSGGLAGPYAREVVTVVSLDGARTYTAQGYPAREPTRLGRAGGALAGEGARCLSYPGARDPRPERNRRTRRRR